MIEMNTDHPRFDPAMEVLVSIPRYPGYTWFSLLREDVISRHAGDACLQRLLGQLKRRGYVVGSKNEKGQGRKLFLLWPVGKTLAASRRYWWDVYRKSDSACGTNCQSLTTHAAT